MIHPCDPTRAFLAHFVSTRSVGRFFLLLTFGLGLLGLAVPAQAQTPVTNVKNGNDNLRLQLNHNGSLYVPGNLITDGTENDSIPATGAGTRMLWYPAKGAFRAGQVGRNSVTSNKEDVWDADSIGFTSVAFGADTRASAPQSTALGLGTVASENESVAMGFKTEANTEQAVAMGAWTTASALRAVAMGARTTASAEDATAMGDSTSAESKHSVAMGLRTTATANPNTVAMGEKTTASGENAVAMGTNTTAQSYSSLVIGRWNTITGDNTSWNSTDPLLVAGNGSGSASRSNALLLRKNGDMTVDGSVTAESHDTPSDRRLKTDIQELGSVLGNLAEIDPVRFRFKEDTGHPEDRQIGLIAQEVQEQFPELVSEGADGYLSLAYPKLTAVLLKGLQEQQKTIEKLKTENEDLRSGRKAIQQKLGTLEDKMARLEAQVGTEHPASAGLMHPWALGGLFLAFLAGGTMGLMIRRYPGME